MRAEFARAIVALHEQRTGLAFITVDLGYGALEGVREALGERFINAGVAEQNAISVAAGLARAGQLPWVYTMATFASLRPYAQLRDNVCLHGLPVKLVGNGGGYGYGIMGATHHALEDLGALRALPNLRLYVPLVAADVPEVVERMAADPLPNYLRLNAAAELPVPVPPFAPWRRLSSGSRAVVVGVGPVLDGVFELGRLVDELEVWSVGTFPLEELPAELAAAIHRTGRVITIEEHYRAGGLGEALAALLLGSGVLPGSFTCLHAAGYPSGRYGSQRFHQEESGLRGQALAARIAEVLGG